MADMQNVLATGQDNLFQSRLDRKQFVGMVDFVATKAKENIEGLTTEMHNALLLIDQRMTVIDRKAEVFDKPETEALEEAFQQFLSTSGVTSLLGAMGVSINGTAYSVASVIETLVMADKIVSKETIAVDGDDLPTQVKYVLHDGFEVIVPYVRSEDPETGAVTITGYTDQWRGLTAMEIVEFQKLTTERQWLGGAFQDVRFNLKKATNIVFDLSGALALAQPIPSAVPDLDADGVIGTPV